MADTDYYKIINNGTFVGAVSECEFMVFQHKHQLLLLCDVEHAQYVKYGGQHYRANWMTPVTTDKISYELADVIRITKEEFDILHEAIAKGEEIPVETEPQLPEISTPIVDPNDAATIEYVKTAKIAEMNHSCGKIIEEGVDVLLSDGNAYHFSLTTQDQLNLITLQSMIAARETSIPYHADGELCRYYSVEDIIKVTDAATAHKTFHVTYYNSLKMYINSLEDISTVSSVEYGMKIPEEYQSDILKALYASMSGEM